MTNLDLSGVRLRHFPTVFFFVATRCLWSATGYATQFTVGGFTGISRSDLRGDNPPGGSYKSITGPVVGLEGGIYIQPDIALIVQPYFIHRGAVVEYRDSQKQNTGPDVSLRLDYLELPLAFRFIAKTDIKPYALGGLSLGVLLKAEQEVEGQTAEDIKDDINAIVGVGVLFPVRSVVLFGEFRYTQGLRNVTVSGLDQNDPATDVRVKNAGAQMLVGILFPLGSP